MTESTPSNSLRRPVISVLLTLLSVFVGFQIIGPLIGWVVTFPFFDGTATEFSAALLDIGNNPEAKVPLLIMQGFAAIFGLVLVPLVLLKKQSRSFGDLSEDESWYLQPALMVPIIVVVSMGINSVFIEWNQGVDLPDWFGFETWAREMEERAGEITKHIINFDSTGELILTIVVVAILPAIGEELVFRGMIQRDLFRATNNAHVAIWVAAIIFSAIHFQFYGFFPRVFLGALFGYLYYWSGSLIMPMIAHFINNGFTLLGMMLYSKGKISIDFESTESVNIETVVVSTILLVALLYAYRTFYVKHARTENIHS
jgi:membrane protease YdiL (CAAX protease family)